MFGIQECVNKTETQLKTIESYMDSHGFFDPYECNLFSGLKRSIQKEIMETFRTISLADILKRCDLEEVLDSTQLATGTLGASGANYLVPSYVSTKLYQAYSYTDIAPAVSADVSQNQSGEKVYVNSLAKALATRSGFGGGAGDPVFNNAEIKLERYTSPIKITNEMMEDNAYGLMQACITGAGTAMAKESNDKICAVLKRTAGTTGIGTKTAEAAGANTTTPTQLLSCAKEVAAGEIGVGMFRPNLVVTTPEVCYDALFNTANHPEIMPPRAPQFYAWYGGFDILCVNNLQMGNMATNTIEEAVTIVLEKEVGIVTARNNWLRIEDYADPVKDLVGAVVSGRQGVGELVDSAIGVLTET